MRCQGTKKPNWNRLRKRISCLFFGVLFTATLNNLWATPWILNNPYPKEQSNQSIYYSSFIEQPKTLDPARAYSSNEYLFISQIYEPLLEYDYFKRPYQLNPLTAVRLPQISYLDAKGGVLPDGDHTKPAFTVYTISIKKGILFQPHPALAKDKKGLYYYHQVTPEFLEEQSINKLSDFNHTGTREVLAEDYIYQIKRLANPAVSSPIYGLMSEHVVGFKEFKVGLPSAVNGEKKYVDLRKYPLKGLKKIDDYTFEITLKGQYKQFLFWLAMPFFSPIPWEADLFYSQQGMGDKNLTFAWYPIGTGAFRLTTNNPNRQIVLEKNPNYREVYFPIKNDKQESIPPRRLPLIDKAIYVLEKESIPRWNKFLQGYFDNSGISADSFDQAIHINKAGEAVLSDDMAKKGIYLTKTSRPFITYLGFNMLDPVVGGLSQRARKLRQAISIAINYDEYIAIFYNGRGSPAQGPLPPSIFGHLSGQAGINPYVFSWKDNARIRRPLKDAKALMVEAGYPNGRDPATKQPLILNYDVSVKGSPEEKSSLDWMRKQFASIGIDLNIRATTYNRFQDKIRTGNAQLFTWGWDADYPDPENFLFLLYGHNSRVKFGGENATNYQNPEFDQLFELMRNLNNNEERQELINKMVEIVREDAPWVWGMHPEDFLLSQRWVSQLEPNSIALGTLKFVGIDVNERNKWRAIWNRPVFWPLWFLLFLLLGLIIPLVFAYFKKEKQPAKRVT